MRVINLLRKLFSRYSEPEIDWERFKRENPELTKEFTQALKDRDELQQMSRELKNENIHDVERLRRILFSGPMRIKCLFETDTGDAYQKMLDSADYLKTDLHKAIAQLTEGMMQAVRLLSERAGRRLLPLTFTRAAVFLCDMLREECHWVLERRPAGEGQTECDIICSEMGCDPIGSISLSEDMIADINRGDRVWRCSKHNDEGRNTAEHLSLADSMNGSLKSRARPGERPVLPSSEQYRAFMQKAGTLTEVGQKPTVGDLLKLMHEADSLTQDHSITIAERMSVRRILDHIRNALDENLPESPGREQLRQDHARYKETFTPEFVLAMERFSESGSDEAIKAFGDLLFPKEHDARLMTILDYADDSARAAYGGAFADWVRLKGYSPTEVTEHVDAQAIQRLTSK